MSGFEPKLDVLPPAQRRLWPELGATPAHFTLYGGTALALRLGHRQSVDFDFFSNQEFDPERLARSVSFLRDAEQIQVEENTLTCRIDRDGAVLVSFFGDLGLGQVAPSEAPSDVAVEVASLVDLAGTKMAVLQKRAEAKDYLDVDALLGHGIELAVSLAAARILYGRAFNPLVTLKALTYFDDVPSVPASVQRRLAAAAVAVDATRLPALSTLRPRSTAPGERS